MSLLMLTIFSLLGLMGFAIVDTIDVRPISSVTTVIEVKKVNPPFTTTVIVGKIPIIQYHPTSYSLLFKIDGYEVETSVEKGFFDNVYLGNNIKVDYGFTRLSRRYKPTYITRVDN